MTIPRYSGFDKLMTKIWDTNNKGVSEDLVLEQKGSKPADIRHSDNGRIFDLNTSTVMTSEGVGAPCLSRFWM